jgi:hypothetical protein
MDHQSPTFDLATTPEERQQSVRFDGLEGDPEVLQLADDSEPHAPTTPFTLGNATHPEDWWQYVSDLALGYGNSLPDGMLEEHQAWFRHGRQLSPLETFIHDGPRNPSSANPHHPPQPPTDLFTSGERLTPREQLLLQIIQNAAANMSAMTTETPWSVATVDPAELSYSGGSSSPANSPFSDRRTDSTPEDIPEVSNSDAEVALVSSDIIALTIVSTNTVITSTSSSDAGSDITKNVYRYDQSTALYHCVHENCDYSSLNRNHMV